MKSTNGAMLLFAFLLGLAVFFVFGGALCQKKVALPAKVELNYWRVWDEEDDFAEIIRAFEERYPYVRIKYRRLTFEEYEDELKTAWALGTGPDIFSIQNTWVTKYQSFIAPMPKETTMTIQTVKKSLGGAKQDVSITKEVHPMLQARDIQNLFVHVVSEDAVQDDQILGLPLSMDTLALYYNQALLERAHLAQPPVTWDAFTPMIPLLTITDDEDNILQAGTALGTSSNVRRSFDLLSLLMIQNHTPADATGRLQLTGTSKDGLQPGVQAMDFFTSFSNPQKETYTWNANMSDSLEAFNQGLLAFYFGYSFDLPIIRSRGQNIRFNIAPMLQVDTEVNYANYWIETVAKTSAHQNESWEFVKFMASDPQVRYYLLSSARPTALKALINEQKGDPDLGIFALQGLTATSWYRGLKPNDAERLLNEAITQSLADPSQTLKILQNAEQRLTADYQ